MKKDTSAPPLPHNPRHQRFADRVLTGENLVDAYLAAGFKCTRETAHANAKKLRKRPDVAEYIKVMQLRAADETTLTVLEMRKFFARIVRTPITSIDLLDKNRSNHDIIKKFKRTETEHGATEEVEKLDPLRACELDIKLSPEDAKADGNQAFAELIVQLGKNYSPIPTEKM